MLAEMWCRSIDRLLDYCWLLSILLKTMTKRMLDGDGGGGLFKERIDVQTADVIG